MTDFRAKLRRRVIWILVGCVLLVAAIVPLAIVGMSGAAPENHTEDFILGMQTGLFFGLLLILLRLVVRYISALRYEEKLEKLYICETDERVRFIRMQIGGTGYDLMLAGLSAATILAGFFDRTVFFTLMAATLAAALLKGGLKLWYMKRT